MKKWTNELNRSLLKEEVQMANKYMKKLLNIPGHKKYINQNHIKILLHSIQNGNHQKHKQQQILDRMWGKRNPYTLWVGM
jgi:hypothetical protein